MSERAYAYAKICGIIEKSFISNNFSKIVLGDTNNIENMIFPGSSGGSDSKQGSLEERIVKRSVASLLSVICFFRKPPPLVSLLMRSYEYADLKNVLNAICAGEETAPHYTNLGKFSTINFSAYPDLSVMLKGTDFHFLLKEKIEFGKIVQGDYFSLLLDKHYYTALLAELSKIPKYDCEGGRKLLGEEISLANCSIAMRLMNYYEMQRDEIKKRLIYGKTSKTGVNLASDALLCLDFDMDHISGWQSWRRKTFLNIDGAGKYWKCDPRYFQNASSLYLYKMARKNLRKRPFTLDTIICFIRLIQFEEQMLKSLYWAVKLGIKPDEVLKGVLV
jgi:vacuolar-type H+-ATPase subunit C/Vma6